MHLIPEFIPQVREIVQYLISGNYEKLIEYIPLSKESFDLYREVIDDYPATFVNLPDDPEKAFDEGICRVYLIGCYTADISKDKQIDHPLSELFIYFYETEKNLSNFCLSRDINSLWSIEQDLWAEDGITDLTLLLDVVVTPDKIQFEIENLRVM